MTDTEIFLIRRWAELGAPVGSSGGDGGIGGATDGGVVGNDGGPPTGPLAGATAPARLAGGYGQVGGFFWIPGDNALLFTDVSASAVFRLLLPSQVTPEFNMTGGMRALAGDGTGNLLATEWTNRRVSITAVGAQPQVVTDAYNGSAFNAPHDLVTANDGQVYFTDPAFGLDGRMRELSFNGLFRIDLQGMPNLEWQGTPSSGPNGVALSPDNSALYMTDTVDGLLLAFTVDPTLGSLSPPRLLLVPGARPTGLAVDTDGNLYVGTAGGVEVYSAAGQLYGTLRTPEPVDNVGWAGNSLDVLVMAVGGALYGAQVNASGQP